MYDLLIVGCGISAATICASLKYRLSICVVDIRDHIGGNCYDYSASGSRIHQYGPHIFHSTSSAVVNFLSEYTEWTPCNYSVDAEIEHDDRLMSVPFPYCRKTAEALGRTLREQEVLEKFFHGYSKKMWGMDWERLPQCIKGRVPKDTADVPAYFPGQFVALPSKGYTHMIENMLDGVNIILSTGPREWESIRAKRVIYTGRPDLIRMPGEKITFGEMLGSTLPHRSVEIEFQDETWNSSACCRHFCSLRQKYTRKASYSRLTGGTAPLVSTETPYEAAADELAPFYPIPLPENHQRYKEIVQSIGQYYPEMVFSGRLGTYKYLDIFQAVGQAMALASKLYPFA